MKTGAEGNNIVPLTPTDQIVSEASLWMTRLDAGMTAAQSRELEAWLDRSAAHRETFEAIAHTWDRLERLKVLADLFPHPARQPARSSRFRWALVTAMLLVPAGWLVNFLEQPARTESATIAAADQPARDSGTFETPIGGRSNVLLNDGSRLILNTLTRVKTEFTPHERAIHLLEGEIHLQVAKDAHRPLRVVVGDRLIEAVGTEFNVQLDFDKSVEVIVTEGKVLVSSASKTTPPPGERSPYDPSSTVPRPGVAVPVVAGQRALVNDRVGSVENVANEQIEAATSWREGDLIFRGESLDQVLREVARYTPLRFEIQDEVARRTRVAGLYRAGDADTLLEALRANFSIDYHRRADGSLVIFSRVPGQHGA